MKKVADELALVSEKLTIVREAKLDLERLESFLTSEVQRLSVLARQNPNLMARSFVSEDEMKQMLKKVGELQRKFHGG